MFFYSCVIFVNIRVLHPKHLSWIPICRGERNYVFSVACISVIRHYSCLFFVRMNTCIMVVHALSVLTIVSLKRLCNLAKQLVQLPSHWKGKLYLKFKLVQSSGSIDQEIILIRDNLFTKKEVIHRSATLYQTDSINLKCKI